MGDESGGEFNLWDWISSKFSGDSSPSSGGEVSAPQVDTPSYDSVGYTPEGAWRNAAAIRPAMYDSEGSYVGQGLMGGGIQPSLQYAPAQLLANSIYNSDGDYAGAGVSGGLAIPTFGRGASDESWLDKVGNQFDKWGKKIETPGGKLAVGLGGGALGLLGAYRQKQAMEEAARRQAEMLAARQAQGSKYGEPIRLANARTAAAAPVARRGASEWFSNNRLPSYYADGGEVGEGHTGDGDGSGSDENWQQYAQGGLCQACGGHAHYVQGGTAGQDDKIPAMLSDGEYVFDADSVASLGDGNNAAGAKKLDQMRQNIRGHKRSGPLSKIPPKAKAPEAYLKGAK